MAIRKTSAKAATATKKTVASKPVETVVEAGKETVETVVKAGVEAASAGYKQAASLTKKQVEQTQKAVHKGYGDFASLSQDNVDAVVKSSTVMAKGLEVLSKEMMDFARLSFEDNVAATKAIFGAKTLTDLVNLQTQYTRKNFDQAVTEGTRLSELSVKVANEAFEPIKARVDVTVGQLVKQIGV